MGQTTRPGLVWLFLLLAVFFNDDPSWSLFYGTGWSHQPEKKQWHEIYRATAAAEVRRCIWKGGGSTTKTKKGTRGWRPATSVRGRMMCLYVFDCFCMFLYANVGCAMFGPLCVFGNEWERGGMICAILMFFLPFLSGAHHCVWRHSLLPHCVHCVPSLVVAPPLWAYNPHAKGSSQLLKWGAATLSALRRQVHSHWKLGPSMALQSSGWNGRVKDWKLGPKGPQEIQFGMKSWCRQPRSTKAISQINVVVRGPRTHTAPSSLVLMVRAPCEKQHGTHKTVWGMYSWGGVPLPNGSPGSPANSPGGGILRIEWLCRSPLLSWPCSACSACLSKMICPDQRSACQGVYDHGERGAGCKPKVAEHVGCLDVFALFKCKSGATNGFVWKWSTPKGSQKSKIHGLSMFIIIGGNPKFWNKTKCVFALVSWC